MSSRFSLGSTTPSEAAASEPLLSRTPATVPRPPLSFSQRFFDSPRRPSSPSFLSSLFSSSDSRPTSPVPVDTRGFDTFPVTIAVGIPLNVLAPPAAEAAIVREVLQAGTTDPSIICDILRRTEFFRHFFPGKREKEIKRSIIQVLDEINFYREGCSKVQIAEMKDELVLLEASVAQKKSVSLRDKAIKVANSFNETKGDAVARKAEEAEIVKSNATRDRNIELLGRRIPYCEERRVRLMADSLVSKFDANNVRECAFVRWCRHAFPPEQNGMAIDELCGTATVSNDDPLVLSAIVDVPQSHDIKFEVMIAGDGTDSSLTSVSLTRLCTPVSPGSRQYVMFEQAFNEDVARRIKDDVKNALFNNFKDVDPPEKADVPTNAKITLFVAKECNPVGQRDVVVTSEDDSNPSCCPSSCSVQGGAKKIKRARQSKKKKVRRSKSKSKRVRRKNKSRRN